MDKKGLLSNGSSVLLLTVTGDEGRRIEGQTDEETKQEIMKTLRKIYGDNIPEPKGMFALRNQDYKTTENKANHGLKLQQNGGQRKRAVCFESLLQG